MKMKKGPSLRKAATGETRTSRNPAEIAMNLVDRFKYVLVGAVAVLLLLIIAGFAYQSIQQNRIDAASRLIEQLEQSYFDWLQASDDNKESAFDVFHGHYSEARESFSRTYAADLSVFLYAQIRYTEEEYQEAAELFSQAAHRINSHLAPVAAMNSAAAYEQINQTDEAIEMYNYVVQSFGSDAAESARAMFSLGRLHENTDIQTALMWYERINEDFPRSEWNQLANNRIIALRYAD
ncbi:tetratricopeptide repeat protein [Spirochaeta dissipatitropha]